MLAFLRVQNFRAHRDFALENFQNPEIITGPNGSGKTSLLEAIYICLRGKSWRSNFAEILRKDSQNFDNVIASGREQPSEDLPNNPSDFRENPSTWWRIDLILANETNKSRETRTVKFLANSENLEAARGGFAASRLPNPQKLFEIDGQVSARLPRKYFKPVILFEPGDLQLLYGSPARRRDFFDHFISQISLSHQTNLNKFSRILKQRNNLLKSGFATPENLFVWDVQFADLAEKIIEARAEFAQKIDEKLTKNYQIIAKNSDQISLKYLAKTPSRAQILRDLKTDFSRGFLTTKFGPQTDDYKFSLNSRAAKTHASRGENRTIIFATLAAQTEILNEFFAEPVYLLFDDIDSELDSIHRANLYQNPVFAKNILIATTIHSRNSSIRL